MKIFIFVIVSLCMQSSCAIANKFGSSCAAGLKDSAKNFITQFKDLHDSSHATVAKIAELCVILFNMEYLYLGGNYSTDLNDARCQLKSFVDGYPEPSAQLLSYFNSVEADCAALLKLGSDFINKNDLNCRPKILFRGCEAQQNALRCELANFLEEIKSNGDSAVALLQGMKSVLSTLDKSVQHFASANDLTCGGVNGSDIDYYNFRTAVNQFFVQFNKNHWTGHIKFINLQLVCDSVTTRVSSLYVKYSDF